MNFLKIIFFLAVSVKILLSQCCEPSRTQLNNNNYFLNNFSTNNISVETINGFDNYFLGVDFAEPFIATNPTDPLNTICAFIGSVYYTLDGYTWSRSMSGDADPFVSFDGSGNAYFTPGIGTFTIFHIAKSTNKGVTWPFVYNVFTGAIDKMSNTAVQTGGPYSNNVYTCLYGAGNNVAGLISIRSTNSGVNWQEPVHIDTEPYTCYCPYITVGPNQSIEGGSLYYAYNFYKDNVNYDTLGIFVKRSTDGGVTFSSAVMASLFFRPFRLKNDVVQISACAQMSADNSHGPHRGNVYIVYTAHGSVYADYADIYFLKSTNYGLNWSQPRKLNDDNTLNDQWMPAIDVDINGKIYTSWYDSRFDPANLMTRLYGSVSTDGGETFCQNTAISNASFNPQDIVRYFGGPGYMGHYIGISAIGNTSYASWTDGRFGNFGSFVGFYPDFAMTVSPSTSYLHSSDSAIITVKIPSINGPFNETVKFTVQLENQPPYGTIVHYILGKDSITNFPDSIRIKVILNNVTVPALYKLSVVGRCRGNGVPVHKRIINLMVNSSFLSIGTNRNGSAEYKLNGVTHNTRLDTAIPNGSSVTVQALSPMLVGTTKRYVFLNWSNGGDTTHSFVINSDTSITAFYKTQFKLILNSSATNTFGGNNFTDSNQNNVFGVLSRQVVYNGVTYRFRGWMGLGNGSYTSPDSTGNDTLISLLMLNPVSETVRWEQIIGIIPGFSEFPTAYSLYQNYPNPFNPFTKIKFDIVEKEFVNITLFDILGRQTGILLNEYKDPGRYEILFNAENLSSGVYYYRITAGKYVNVKKMIIIK